MTCCPRAVVRGTQRALVVGDLPFGSYQDGPVQALARPPAWSRRPASTR